jgi:hypothetical protein
VNIRYFLRHPVLRVRDIRFDRALKVIEADYRRNPETGRPDSGRSVIRRALHEVATAPAPITMRIVDWKKSLVELMGELDWIERGDDPKPPKEDE